MLLFLIFCGLCITGLGMFAVKFPKKLMFIGLFITFALFLFAYLLHADMLTS